MSWKELGKIILLISIINICLSQKAEKCTVKQTEESKNGDQVGFMFETPCQITKITFAQKSEKASMVLGLFFGANDPSFIDAAPLHLITEAPKQVGETTSIEIKVTKPFLYVRYVGPKGNVEISDFKVEGIASAKTENEGENDDSTMYQPTNIPLLVINTEQFKEPPSTKEQVNCHIYVISDGKINVVSTGTVKRRGNSTGRLEKGSYRIKFEKKQKILDLSAKAKKWAILANHMDHTLIRNLVAFKVSSVIGHKFTPECRSIDLIFNGDFRGNHIICDQVEVHKGRIELDEMDENATEEPEITGGYFMEIGGGGWGGGTTKYKTTKGLTYTIGYPGSEDLTAKQKTYITEYMNSVESGVYEEIYDGIDLDSFLKEFLIQEYCANIDCVHGNYYVTKQREDKKLYFGPIWDFDLALDNDRRLYPTNEKVKYAFKYGDSTGTLRDFIIKILSNENNLKALKEKWEKISKDGAITKEVVGFIENQAKLIADSQKLNFMRWNILSSQVMFENKGRGSFEAEIEVLKNFIEGRVEALSKMIDETTTENIGEGIEKRGGWGGGGDWGGDWGGFGGNGGGRPRRNNTNYQGGQGGFGGFGGQ